RWRHVDGQGAHPGLQPRHRAVRADARVAARPRARVAAAAAAALAGQGQGRLRLAPSLHRARRRRAPPRRPPTRRRLWHHPARFLHLRRRRRRARPRRAAGAVVEGGPGPRRLFRAAVRAAVRGRARRRADRGGGGAGSPARVPRHAGAPRAGLFHFGRRGRATPPLFAVRGSECSLQHVLGPSVDRRRNGLFRAGFFLAFNFGRRRAAVAARVAARASAAVDAAVGDAAGDGRPRPHASLRRLLHGPDVALNRRHAAQAAGDGARGELRRTLAQLQNAPARRLCLNPPTSSSRPPSSEPRHLSPCDGPL
ncbi:hypothetical protein M885DRAFT_609832, partial [Pelagophyceae sp. CCMP2097]